MRDPRLRADHGFTLVEVLVVVLIIGILAAIALPAFLDQREKAQDAEAKTAVVTAAKAMATYATEHGDGFTGATPQALVQIETSLGRARGLSVTSTTDAYTVSVDSATGGGARFSIRHTVTGDVRDCTRPGTGACGAGADSHGNRW